MSWQNLRADIIEEFDAVASPPPLRAHFAVPLAHKAFEYLSRNAYRRRIDHRLKHKRRQRPRWRVAPCTVVQVRMCNRCEGHYESREGCARAIAVHKWPCRG